MIYIIILILIIISLTIYILAYRRQVRNICRQMSFHMDNDSNILVTRSVSAAEIDSLIECINRMLVSEKELRKKYYRDNQNLLMSITNLSHDIRTPLTSLDGYFQLLAESTDSEERAHYNDIITRRLRSLKDMLDELFTYTKLQNNEYELELTSCSLSKIVFDTVFSFYDAIRERGFEPELNIPDAPIMLMLNEAAMTRVIQNIIKNGLIHGNRHMRVQLSQIKGKVTLIIENSFDTVNDIAIDKVFDRFYKAGTARSELSTGLGLSISKDLVNKMNGNIAASVHDDYFTITITFFDVL